MHTPQHSSACNRAVIEAAAVRDEGCNRVWWRLQSGGGCNRKWWRQQQDVVGRGTIKSTPPTMRKEANSHVPLDCRM